MTRLRYAGVIAFLLSYSASIWAQAVSTSQIKGAVRDPTGGAVPGAQVKITQTATSAERTVTTATDGSYVVTNLTPGPYQLEVSKQGFSTYVRTGITLQVASNPTVDVTLQVGQVTQQVQVEAAAAMVETQNTGVGQVIDSQRVVDLPLVGRQVQDLIVLSGAATQGSDPAQISNRNYPGVQGISVAGGLATGTSYVLDGSLHNDAYTNANLPLPFPDALQEFKVETSALPAQYGMHSGAAVNAVTKSGTNAFHGTGFEFVRNYKFNARQFFAPRRDTLKRNQFGGTIGGPIKKDKLFFFAGYQQTDTRQDPNNITTFVPTTAMMNGDFSTVASGVCQRAPVMLRDPFNPGQFFPNNQIPVTELSVPALKIASQLPAAPDQQCGRTTYGLRVLDNEHFGVAKIDYQLSATHSMFFRYLGTQDKQPVPYTLSDGNLLTTGPGGNGFDDFDQSFTIGDTYLFGANIVNSFRATVDRTAIARTGAQFFGPQDVGINIYSYLPKFTSITVTGGFAIGNLIATDSTYRTTTLQFGDDLGWIKGNHQIGLGFDLSHWNSNTYARVLAMGPMTFSGQITGLGIADFFTGSPSQFLQSAPNVLFVRDWYFGLYGQDSWKIRPNLTFNYGLRWEPFFPMTFANGIVYHFDLAAFITDQKTTQFKNAPPGLFYPGDPGFPDKAGIRIQWKQFAPRVGLVWDPEGNGKMSVRASFGTFYDTIPAQYNLNTETAPPWGARTVFTPLPGHLSDPFAGQSFPNPFPVTFNADSPYTLNGTFNTFDYNTPMTYVEQWNLSVQRQFGKDWLASISYLGNHMVHLFGARELNPGVYSPGATLSNLPQRRLFNSYNPAYGKYFGYTDTWDSGGTGSFNGLLLSVQKRLSQNFTLTSNFTWSHCIGNQVNELPNAGFGGGGVYLYPDNRHLDRGNCNTSATDHRYIANMTGVGEMPKFSNKWENWLASDWRGSATVSMQSGMWLDVLTGVDNALTGVGGQRPNLAMANIYGDGSIANYLNPHAFSSPAPGTYGNAGPGIVEGPGSLIFNAGLSRLFPIRESQTLELRAEAQNVLNRTNFANPSTTLTSNTFGQITASGPARIMQFAVKYVF